MRKHCERLIFTVGAVLAFSVVALAQTAVQSGAAGSKPVPRTPDGKPDMSGVWAEMNYLRWEKLPEEDEQWVTPRERSMARELTPATRGLTFAEARDPRPFLPWALKLHQYGVEPLKEKEPDRGRDRNELNKNCFPRDPKRIMDNNVGPVFEIVQSTSRLLFLMEDDHWFRQIGMNEEHPRDVAVTWMGHSVGKWDGDTLVIDTIAVDDRNSYPAEIHTDAFHLVERLTRVSHDTIQGIVTVDDPKVYSRPWTEQTVIYKLRPDWKINENVRCDHRFGKKIFYGAGDI